MRAVVVHVVDEGGDVRLAEEARLKLEMGRLLRRPEASDEEYRLVEPLLLLLPLPLKPVLLELLLARPLF